jgi:hypothetical protein
MSWWHKQCNHGRGVNEDAEIKLPPAFLSRALRESDAARGELAKDAGRLEAQPFKPLEAT